MLTSNALRPRHLPRAAATAALFGLFAQTGCVVHAGAVARPHETVTAEVIVRPPPPVVQATVVVEEPVDNFVQPLSSYGVWIVTARCGRVWRPHAAVVGVGFEPYVSGGEWVYTDYGWSFETDWDWGWAVFHYGRWCPDPHHGWVWVPGNVWASSWVEWRTGGGFIGWAPLLPPGMVIVEEHWSFVHTHHFHDRHPDHGRHHPDRYRLPPAQRRHALEHTRPVHDVVSHGTAKWSRGPSPRDVEREVGVEVRPVHVVPPAPGTIRRAGARPPEARPNVALPGVVKPPEVKEPPPVQGPPVVKPPEPKTPPVVKPPESKTPPVVKPPEPKTPPVVKPPVVRPPVVVKPPEPKKPPVVKPAPKKQRPVLRTPDVAR